MQSLVVALLALSLGLSVHADASERIANNGTMYLGDDDWLGPVNAIAQANTLNPLVWNQTLVDILTQAARNSTSRGAPCGFVNSTTLPGIFFTRATPSWQTTGTAYLLFLQTAGMLAPASLQPTDGLYLGMPIQDIQRLGYVFGGPSPVSIGCIVQSCNSTYTSTYCLTNLTAGGPADNFNLSSRASQIPIGRCQPYAYVNEGNATIESIQAASRNAVTARQISCWYDQLSNVNNLPAVIGIPCPDDASNASCPAWNTYTALNGSLLGGSSSGSLNYTSMVPNQNISQVAASLGLSLTSNAACRLCCLNGLQTNTPSCSVPPNTTLTINLAQLNSTNLSVFGNCPCLNGTAPTPPPAPAPAPAPVDTSSSGLSGGAIAGIVVGSVAGVVLIASLLAMLLLRKKKGAVLLSKDDKQASMLEKGGFTDPNSSIVTSNKGSVNVQYHGKDSDPSDSMVSSAFDQAPESHYQRVKGVDSGLAGNSDNWLRPPSDAPTYSLTHDQLMSLQASQGTAMLDMRDVVYDEPPIKLGRGGFGEVYAATFKGQRVAVKDLITTMGRSTDDMLARFECIIAEVKSLKKCNHPNLVHCLGVVANTWPLKLLYELCEGGDLHKQLSGEHAAQWQWANKGRFVALDIAKGLKYLNEELKMVHLDIKSSNVLLTADGHAKVGDFGLAKFLKDEDDVQEFSKLPCSPAYAAPEQLIHQEVSFAVDIFSFGVVMLELLMGQPAPTNRRYPEIEPSATCPAEIVELVGRCMDETPSKRPKIAEVYGILKRHTAEAP